MFNCFITELNLPHSKVSVSHIRKTGDNIFKILSNNPIDFVTSYLFSSALNFASTK